MKDKSSTEMHLNSSFNSQVKNQSYIWSYYIDHSHMHTYVLRLKHH